MSNIPQYVVNKCDCLMDSDQIQFSIVGQERTAELHDLSHSVNKFVLKSTRRRKALGLMQHLFGCSLAFVKYSPRGAEEVERGVLLLSRWIQLSKVIHP